MFSVPGMAAPGPRMPPMPDRIVIHSEPQKNSPAPPQEQPSQPPQQPPAVPQQSATQTPTSTNQTAPVKSRLSFSKKLSDTLELKKIPRDMNNIAKLNEHFQRFGTITNIQVCFILCGSSENHIFAIRQSVVTTKILHQQTPGKLLK